MPHRAAPGHSIRPPGPVVVVGMRLAGQGMQREVPDRGFAAFGAVRWGLAGPRYDARSPCRYPGGIPAVPPSGCPCALTRPPAVAHAPLPPPVLPNAPTTPSRQPHASLPCSSFSRRTHHPPPRTPTPHITALPPPTRAPTAAPLPRRERWWSCCRSRLVLGASWCGFLPRWGLCTLASSLRLAELGGRAAAGGPRGGCDCVRGWSAQGGDFLTGGAGGQGGRQRAG